MAPQTINIDPNLMVNAQSKGTSDAFNYGTGAQVIRASDAANRTAQAEFLYGSGAEADRQSTINSRDAAADFNYGDQAREVRDVNMATERLRQDVTLFDLNTRKVEEERVGTINRDNRALAAQGKNRELQALDAVMTSPAGGVMQAQIAQAQAKTMANGTFLSAMQSEHALTEQQIGQETQLAELNAKKVQAVDQSRVVQNRSRIASDLAAAKQADAEARAQGNLTPSGVVNYLDGLVKSDYTAAQDAADIIDSSITDVDRQFGLPPALKSSVGDIRKAASYVTSGTAIRNTVSGLTQARAGGQLAPTGNKIISAIHATGIDSQDTRDLENLSVESTGDGYTIVNNATASRSQLFTQDEYDNSPELQALHVSSQKRQRTKDNVFTKHDQQQAVIADIQNNPLHPEIGNTYSRLVNNLSSSYKDAPAVKSALLNVMQDYQLDTKAANPFMREGGEQLFAETGMTSGVIGKALFGESLSARLDNDPVLADELVSAYKNRATGGMDPAVFNTHVDKIVKTVTLNDNRYQVTAGNPPAAVDARLKDLRNKVIRNLQVSRNDDATKAAYDIAVKKYPSLAITEVDPRIQKPGGFLKGLRVRLLGYDSVADATTNKTMAE